MEEKTIEFEYIHVLEKTRSANRCSKLNTIILNLSQRLSVIVCEETILMHPYSMMIIQAQKEFSMNCCQGSEIVLIRFDKLDQYYEKLICNYAISAYENSSGTIPPLEMTIPLRTFTCSLVDSYRINFSDRMLLELKFRELQYLLFDSFALQKIVASFTPLIVLHNSTFRSKVLENYSPQINVKQLADICGYTLAHFGELFRKEFKMLPKEWLRIQLAKLIEEKLANPDYSIQEISSQIGMSSPQQMTRFCKKTFGKSPSEIRLSSI